MKGALRFGCDLARDPTLAGIERVYTRLFGPPILGLRIRARYLLPILHGLRREPFRRIADAGSGRGCFTVHLARLFPEAEVIGFDLDAGQVERNNAIVRRVGLSNCRFAVQDVTRIPAREVYDFILSADNLEHLEDDRAQCGVFFRALRPGGRILFHVPHLTRNVFGRRRTNFLGIEGHVRAGYTREGLCAMLRDAGFAIERGSYSYDSIETLANDLSYAITGGRELRKALYGAAFPILLALARCGSAPRGDGSGLIVLARRPGLTGR